MYYLASAKFKKNGGCSTVFLNNDNQGDFDPELDTMGMVAVENGFAVAHHTYFKCHDGHPVEIFLKSGKKSYLPNESCISYPTSLASKGNLFCVAANGLDFASSLWLYELKDGTPTLLNNINLPYPHVRPTGLAIFGEYVFYTSYSGQSVIRWDPKTNTLDKLIQVSDYSQTTPISVKCLDGMLLITGHVDGSLSLYDQKYFLPNKIYREHLSKPWGVEFSGDLIYIANISDTGENYILKLTKNFDFVEKYEMDGIILISDYS